MENWVNFSRKEGHPNIQPSIVNKARDRTDQGPQAQDWDADDLTTAPTSSFTCNSHWARPRESTGHGSTRPTFQWQAQIGLCVIVYCGPRPWSNSIFQAARRCPVHTKLCQDISTMGSEPGQHGTRCHKQLHGCLVHLAASFQDCSDSPVDGPWYLTDSGQRSQAHVNFQDKVG